MTQAEPLPAPFDFDTVIADIGYDSDPLRELLAAQQVEVVIPSRRYRRQPRDYDRVRYRERNIVKRFINKIKCCRRIFTRYEKLARRFIAFLHFSSALIRLKRNINDPKSPRGHLLMYTKHKAIAIGVLLVLFAVLGAAQLQAQEEEITLQEYLERLMELVLESREIVNEIAETAAKKSEVRALETRVAALETAMPWPTATPTVTPTPTPFPDDARNFAQKLAVDDHAGLWRNFSDFSENEQSRIISVYQDYFVKTSEVCNLDLSETYELLQKYAERFDGFSPRALETRLRNMGMPNAGWRFDYIARIASNSLIQEMIRDDGCDSYLKWYTSG